METDYDEIVAIFEDEEDIRLSAFLLEEPGRLNPEENKLLNRVFEENDGDPGAAHDAILLSCKSISFAAGFIFGQMFEICDKEAVAVLTDLKKKFIDGGVLKYQPREKK